MALKTAVQAQQPSAERITITSPVTGEVVGSVQVTSQQGVAEAATRARAAQPEWAARPFRERARIVKRFHDIMLRDKEELISLLRAEAGKQRRDAFIEIFAMANEARYYSVHGWRHIRPRRVKTTIPLRDHSLVVYQPYGVVGLVGAYNFPILLTIGDAIPALLAGNAVVAKPSELVPLSSEWGRSKLIEAGLPEELLQIVHGAGQTGAAVVDGVDYMMFTGSIATGRKVAVAASSRLIPFIVELGGKNSVIVLEDANLRHAALATIDGAFSNGGQICLCWERIYVHEAVYDKYIGYLMEELGRLRMVWDGDGQGDLGAIVDEAHVDRVDAHVQDALAKGARLLTGGRRRLDMGRSFYEPTVLTDVMPEMSLHAEETFGPVIAVYRFSSEDEAVRMANDTDTGLSFGVFTRNRRRGVRLAQKLQAGTVAVNDASYITWGAMGGPLGGMKNSGIGRRHGVEGIRQFTQPQTILVNHTNDGVRSHESALAMNRAFEELLTLGLKLWRHIPLIR